MTPEEIQQVVEDYRKSSQPLNEFVKVDWDQLRNLGRDKRDQVNGDNNKNKNNIKKNNNNGAQGNGAQSSTSSSTTGAQGVQGGTNNDNVSGAQGAQSSTVTGAQGAQGGQGPQTNTIKKNEIDLDAIRKYSRNSKEVTINDFGGIKPSGAQGAQVGAQGAQGTQVGAQGAQTKEIKPKLSPATFKTNQRQSRELVSTGKLKDTDLNKYSRSNTYTADDGKTQVNRSTVNTIAQFDMGPRIKKGDKLGVISGNLRKKYDLKASNFKAEAYDVVLDYVLSEGHADSVEEAHYVMMQLDEETIKEFIKKAALIGTGGVLAYKGLKKASDKFNNYLNDLRNNSKFGGNKRVDDVRTNSGDPNVGQKYNFGAQGNKPNKP